MRKIAYLGNFERVDMRNAVGKDDMKFIFFGALDPAQIRRRTPDEVKEAARQHAEGVEVSNEDALKILTSPNVPAGFYDYTDKEIQPATAADAQMVSPQSVGPNAVVTPVAGIVYDDPVIINAEKPVKDSKQAK